MIRQVLPPRVRDWIRDKSLRLATIMSGFDATRYWEERYATGGTSGEGSYGRLADFKAAVLNDFIAEHAVQSVIEFGCGDGNQLSLLRAPSYVGLDVAASALRRCIDRFNSDATKSFFLFDGSAFHDAAGIFEAELALSLDVIYHLVSDQEFESYMGHVCAASRKHLVLYTTDNDGADRGHQRHRHVSKWMQQRRDFVLRRSIPNPYSGSEDNQGKSDAMFLIYERVIA